MLGLARNRSAGQEPTNLIELVENTLLLLEREMNKYRITVDKSFQPIPEAYVNGNQIQQVLLNLLINARQAMPSGGRVPMKLVYDAENDMIDLVVRDNGCGIPAEQLPRIFEPSTPPRAVPTPAARAARAWDSRCAATSSRPITGGSASIAPWARAPPSRSSCPR